MRLAICGTGVMGRQIAVEAVLRGMDVVLWNQSGESADRARVAVSERVARLFREGKVPGGRKPTELSSTNQLRNISDADLVLEAIPEDLWLKCELFRMLGQVCAGETIFATNTSSLSITKLAHASGRPDRFCGIHLFNPVHRMQLAEIVGGMATSPRTFREAVAFAIELGKTPVVVPDGPGFVVNRVLLVMINEAIRLLEQTGTTAKVIDDCLQLGCNHPMGPLALADLIGLDVCLAILECLHVRLGGEQFRPADLLRRKVDAGMWGRKSERGFYDYTAGPDLPPRPIAIDRHAIAGTRDAERFCNHD